MAGAPWGGAHGPAADLARFLRYFSRAATARAAPAPLGAASARAMITPQTPPGPTAEAEPPRYGLGFRLGPFAQGASPRSFGHGGATGVTAWLDPDADLLCVLLTTRPAALCEASLLRPVSDLVARATA